MRLSHFLDEAILLGAAWLVPSPQRTEWLREWKSELWYVRQKCNRELPIASFCLGAFQDALWLRQNSPSSETHRKSRLESPAQSILFLATCAAAALSIALLLPGARNEILPSPYRNAPTLAMISSHGRFNALWPTISFDRFQLLKKQQRVFPGMAFYQPAVVTVTFARRHIAGLSIAHASDNLFDLLQIPGTPQATNRGSPEHVPQLILNRHTWRKYFNGDPHIVGQVLYINGEQAMVAAVISADYSRVPVPVDAWLLEDERHLAALPSDSKGFVVANLNPSAVHPRRGGLWHVFMSNEEGGTSVLDCQSLAAPVHSLLTLLLFMIVLPCLILPMTTSLSLGERPASWRYWIFLAGKITLALPIVYCGTLDIGYVLMPAGALHVLPQLLLAGSVVGFRWALIDQRRRCPACLRLLGSPARIGRPSLNFLGWYGTEFMCMKGHGLLHVPMIRTSWSRTQSWLPLGPSWSSLFHQ